VGKKYLKEGPDLAIAKEATSTAVEKRLLRTGL
jgi:hypothetical protein